MVNESQSRIDADPLGAHWLKVRTWDLPTEPGESLIAIRATSGTLTGQRERLAFLMELPSAIPMPNELQDTLIQAGLL